MFSKEKKEDISEAFSLWCNGSHRRLHQSQWLQANLSEFDEKVQMIVSTIEEDGDSFAKRAEIYFKRRPQILKAIDDLHKSYRCLALKYDHLLRRSINNQNIPIFETDGTYLVLSTSDEIGNNKDKILETTPQTLFEIEDNNSTSSDYTRNNFDDEDSSFEYYSRDRSWSEKEVSELIEDHLRQQSDLAKRNEDKRQVIKELRSEIKKLMDENRALKSINTNNNSVCLKSKTNNKSKGTLYQLGKLTGCSR